MVRHRIEAELLIPGAGDPLENGTVILEEGAIRFSGSASEAPARSDEKVTEVPVVMPGLWECHGHFLGISNPDLAYSLREPMALKGVRAANELQLTLEGGVTTVREVGGLGLELNQAITAGEVAGPHLHAAGSALSQTGGHGDLHELPLAWVEAAAVAGDRFSYLCDGVDECIRAVRSNLRRGARVIKVHASGGVMSAVDDPIHQQFTDAELAAIVSEAGRFDRAVAAHCHGKAGIMAALRAGVKTIEHGSYLDQEAAEAMKEADAILVPTRFVIEHLLTLLDSIPAYAVAKITAIADQHRSALETAVAAGVRIAMGTDIFIHGDSYGRNGREIAHLVDAGMTPLDAIEAATANGPHTLGRLAPSSGQLLRGYDADVIALDFNPLEDLSGWGDRDRVTHVWKSGVLVKSPHQPASGSNPIGTSRTSM